MTGPTSLQHVQHCLGKAQEGPNHGPGHQDCGHLHVPEKHEQSKTRQQN